MPKTMAASCGRPGITLHTRAAIASRFVRRSVAGATPVPGLLDNGAGRRADGPAGRSADTVASSA
jgi:hypothetical protein